MATKRRGKRVRQEDSSDSSPERYNDPCSFDTSLVLGSKVINFAAFEDFGILELFEHQNWVEFVFLREPYYPELVKEFNKNLRIDGQGFVTFVKKIKITFNHQVLDRLLRTHLNGKCVFEKKGWPQVEGFDQLECIERLSGRRLVGPIKLKAKDLNLTAKLIHHIIGYIILPRSGHRDEISAFDHFLIDSIMLKRRLSLGFIIGNFMMVAKEKKRAALPYGAVITRLLRAHRVPLQNEAQITKVSTMNATTLHQMHIYKGPDGPWSLIFPKNQGSSSRAYDDNEDEIKAELDTAAGYRPGQDHDADPSGTQSGTFRFTEEHYNMMQSRLDLLTGTVDELHGATNTRFDHFDARLIELSSPSTPWLSINKLSSTKCIVTYLRHHYCCPSNRRFYMLSCSHH